MPYRTLLATGAVLGIAVAFLLEPAATIVGLTIVAGGASLRDRGARR